MHVLIVGVVGVYGEFRGGRSQVALGEEVERAVVVEEDPDANVELPLVYQERLLYILLQNERIVLDLVLRLLLRGLLLRHLQRCRLSVQLAPIGLLLSQGR